MSRKHQAAIGTVIPDVGTVTGVRETMVATWVTLAKVNMDADLVGDNRLPWGRAVASAIGDSIDRYHSFDITRYSLDKAAHVILHKN